MRAFKIAALGAVATLACGLVGTGAPAYANTIQYTNFLVYNDVNVTITCNTLPNCTSGYYGSGQIDLYNSGTPTAQIWCIDVTHDLQGPWSSGPGLSTYTFNVTPWHSEGGGLSNIWSGGAIGSGTQLTNHVVGELGALAQYGDVNINNVLLSGASTSSAIQLAIWDVEYNGGASNLSGALTLASDSLPTQTLAKMLVNDVKHGLLGFDTNVDWLTCGSRSNGACNQGQIEVMGPHSIPEPGSLVLFGSGLLGLGGIAALRRRRRNVDALG